MLKLARIDDEYPEAFRKAIGYIRKKEGYDYSITELSRPLQEIYLSSVNDYEIDALKNQLLLIRMPMHLKVGLLQRCYLLD